MKLDCNKSKIFRLPREEKFPTPMRWGVQIRWLESSIDDYINSFERVCWVYLHYQTIKNSPPTDAL